MTIVEVCNISHKIKLVTKDMDNKTFRNTATVPEHYKGYHSQINN